MNEIQKITPLPNIEKSCVGLIAISDDNVIAICRAQYFN